MVPVRAAPVPFGDIGHADVLGDDELVGNWTLVGDEFP
jgi:hypothetical protein